MQYLKRQLGFSLIELIITMSVIGLIVGVTLVWPGKTINLNAQIEQLATDIRYTQFLAMTRNERIRLNFGTNSYRLSNLDDTTAIHFPAIGQNTINLDSGITLTVSGLQVAAPQYVVFDELGIPYSDAIASPGGQKLTSDAQISLSAENTIRTLIIAYDTGRVSES